MKSWLSEEDFSRGNITRRIFNFTFNSTKNNVTSPFSKEFLELFGGKYGLPALGLNGAGRDLLEQVEKEFERELAVYNNVSFLILSITGLVSSTILVVVTVKSASRRELLIVIVEGLVVVLFLSVVTHALIVFSRSDDYVVDYHVRQDTVHYYEPRNATVEGHFRIRDVVVGKRNSLPVVLITTEVLAIISTLIVVGNIVHLLSKRRKMNEENHDDGYKQDNDDKTWISLIR